MKRIISVFFAIFMSLILFMWGCDDASEDKDTTPPTVMITSPLNDTTVVQPFTIKVEATDDEGVVKVTFLIDDEIIGEDLSEPYEQYWDVTSLADGNTHSLLAKATDAAGNVGLSDSIYVQIMVVPELVRPGNGEMVRDTTTVLFSWHLLEGADNYNIVISSSIDFSITVYGASTQDTTIIVEELPPGINYWRVRSRDTQGLWGAWSNVWSFTVTGPDAPALLYPADSSRITDTDTVRLKWASSINAVTYEAIITSDSQLNNPEYVVSTEDTTTVIADLSQGVHYWKVRSKDIQDLWGDWSVVKSFTVTGPDAPILYSPANNFVITNADTTKLLWSSSENAVEYEIAVSAYSFFAFVDTINTEDTTVTTGILSQGIHYWKVRARNSSGLWGGWSNSWNFVVTGPNAPALISPADNAVITDANTVQLSWTSSDNATEYEINISSDSLFSETEYGIVTGDTSIVTDTISDGSYFWRVRAKNGVNMWGTWSTNRRFIMTGPEPPALISPADSLVVTDTSVVQLLWTNSVNATEYEVAIYNNPEFTITEYVAVTTDTMNTTSDLLMGNHYWRVRGKNVYGLWGAWSEVRRFTITGPEAPVLISPADSLVYTAGNTIQISWLTSENAVKYEVIVTSDSLFTDFDFSRITPDTTLTTDELSQGLHYWRVRAINTVDYQGAWSQGRSFSMTGPNAPALMNPTDGQIITENDTVSLSWSESENAVSFKVLIAADSLFTTREDSILIEDTSVLSGGLSQGLHFWKVQAKNEIGFWGPWSSYRSFKLDGPAAPSSINPADGFVITEGNTAQLLWSGSENAVQYMIIISSKPQFTDTLYSIIAEETTVESDVLLEGIYFWKVRAKNTADFWGEWSSIRKFSVYHFEESITEQGFSVVLVPGGDYTFGIDNQVQTIDYDFEIMKFEVTNAQYLSYLEDMLVNWEITVSNNTVQGYYTGDEEWATGEYEYLNLDNSHCRIDWNGSSFSIESGYEDHPVVAVTWFGANAFATHYAMSLPTEEEWEKAARGNLGIEYPWGENISGNEANYWNSGDPWDNGTTPVGYYNGENNTINSPSPFGAYDMAGNVWEWTHSWYTEGGSERVQRGGSWFGYINECKYWNRNYSSPQFSYVNIGFRCVKRLEF